MKLRLPCLRCIHEEKKLEYVKGEILIPIEMRDDGIYSITCPNGHKSLVCIQEQKFEILFDLGGMALLDGYAKEAVSTFSSAFERFYEFYIRVIVTKFGISPEEFEKNWKLISNQSERQLGAFIFLYLMENKKAIEFIKPKYISFRNDVIHKGYIPSFEEACQYGEHLFSFIVPILRDLKKKNSEFIQEIIFQDLRKKYKDAKENVQPTTMTASTMLRIAASDKENKSKNFREALEELNKNRHILYTP